MSESKKLTDGFMLLNKAEGISSARLLGPLKQAWRKSLKVGHAGTLDPFASGLMIALVGDATRLSPLAMELPKRYQGQIRFGFETDTLDPKGQVIAEKDPGQHVPDNLPVIVQRFLGEIEQTPPVYSALKVQGKPAYALSREGQPPILQSRRVNISEFKITNISWPDVDFDIRCSAGTYIRSLARDLGQALHIPGTLIRLNRLEIGPFNLELSHRLSRDERDRSVNALQAKLRSSLELIQGVGMPCVHLGEIQARDVALGRTPDLQDRAIPTEKNKIALTYDCPDWQRVRLLAIATREKEQWQPSPVLARAQKSLLARQP